MSKDEFSIGLLTLVGEVRGFHVHVSILGAGLRGQRPLCGSVVMRPEEFESLGKLLEIAAEQDRTIGELRQDLEMATGPHCPSCGNAIDPDTCHCGDYEKGHGDAYEAGHGFVPMGCICGYAEPNWKQLAKARGELLWKQRAETSKLMAASGPTVEELTAEIERLTRTTDLGIAVADARRLRVERDRMRPVFDLALKWQAAEHVLNANHAAGDCDECPAREVERELVLAIMRAKEPANG